MRNIKNFLIGFILAVYTLAPLPVAAYNPIGSACSQVNSGKKSTDPTSSICTNPGSGDPVVHVIHVAAGIIALLAGVIAVIIIIVSGISMITSAGNTESVSNARKRLTGAIIGLVIVALAYLIVTFLIDKLIA